MRCLLLLDHEHGGALEVHQMAPPTMAVAVVDALAVNWGSGAPCVHVPGAGAPAMCPRPRNADVDALSCLVLSRRDVT